MTRSVTAGSPDLGVPPSAAPPAHTIEQRFSVSYEYPVVFLRGLFKAESRSLEAVFARFPRPSAGKHRLFAAIDEGVAKTWPALSRDLRQALERADSTTLLADEPLVVPGGELVKNDPRVVETLYRKFQDLGLDRHSFVMAIGGGAVLDAVGFATATAHRGLRLIRVPTTVLSQSDSGVGVKNGVNLFESKNFLGTFSPPVAVLNDFDFLETLAERDRIAGMAEAVKVGLIKDRAFFEWIEQASDALRRFAPQAVERLIRRTAELHVTHIANSGDAFEQGSARPLDYGHWVAHKLESMTQNALRHGEAVAIGLAIDTFYSAAKGFLPTPEAERVCALLERLGLPTWHPALDDKDERNQPRFLEGLEEFRQHLGGELSVTLLREIGAPYQADSIDTALVVEQTRHLKKRYELGNTP